jgi:hypothetical protein
MDDQIQSQGSTKLDVKNGARCIALPIAGHPSQIAQLPIVESDRAIAANKNDKISAFLFKQKLHPFFADEFTISPQAARTS